MKRTWKEHLLGDWSVIDWLYAFAGLACGFLLILAFVLALPGGE